MYRVRRVLIIDDEADQCLLVCRVLISKNYQADFAYSLAEGLRKLDELHPDSLLLNNNLPDGLGWQEAQRIQRLYPEMHITFISAYEASPYAITANGIGFQKIEKPITFKNLESYL